MPPYTAAKRSGRLKMLFGGYSGVFADGIGKLAEAKYFCNIRLRLEFLFIKAV